MFARKIFHALMAPTDIQKEFRVIEAVCKDDTQENIVKVLGTGMLKTSSLYFVDMERCSLKLLEYLRGKLPMNVPGNSMNEPFSKGQGEWKRVQKAWYIVEQISNGIGFSPQQGSRSPGHKLQQL